MNTFKDFGIKPEIKTLQGDKIKIDRILNCEIIVEDFQINDSKFKDKTEKCLTIQFKKGEQRHIIFTGSMVLANMIQKVQKANFPFKTIIVKNGEHFEFT